MSNLITPQKIKEFGRDYVKILTRELLRAGKDASGQLIRSINYKIVEDAEIIRMVILAEKYLEFVDKGRKPGSYSTLSISPNLLTFFSFIGLLVGFPNNPVY